MRFSATALDLSRVNKADLWPAHSFEAIRAARIADLKARLDAAGVPYDVDTLETDPGVVLQEASGYRELLTKQAIDDAQQQVLLAFGFGEWLDRLGDLHGTARLPGESDDRYRTRIQLAPEAFPATGTPGGYIYHASTVSTDVRDVGLTVLRRGTPDVMVELTVLAKDGEGVPPEDLITAVRERIYADDVKLLTDVIVVRPAVVLKYDVSATLYVKAGPDPTIARTLALSALNSTADRYKRLGGGIPRNAIDVALYVPAVERVVVDTPAADLMAQRYQALHLRSATIKTVVLGD